jgi:uncharacterized paraquat-inducible protein A
MTDPSEEDDRDAVFAITGCEACGAEHYNDEPCPRCTAGSYAALEERLSAALRRERALLNELNRWKAH